MTETTDDETDATRVYSEKDSCKDSSQRGTAYISALCTRRKKERTMTLTTTTMMMMMNLMMTTMMTICFPFCLPGTSSESKLHYARALIRTRRARGWIKINDDGEYDANSTWNFWRREIITSLDTVRLLALNSDKLVVTQSKRSFKFPWQPSSPGSQTKIEQLLLQDINLSNKIKKVKYLPRV